MLNRFFSRQSQRSAKFQRKGSRLFLIEWQSTRTPGPGNIALAIFGKYGLSHLANFFSKTVKYEK